MSFRTSILPAIDAARGVVELLGLRTNQVTVRTRTWSGARVGVGTASDSDLVLPARYKVRLLSSGEISASGGQYEIGDILVDHITPSDGAGTGYTTDQLSPEITTNNVELIYVITGDHPGEYAKLEFRAYKPFTYQLVLRRRISTP